MKKVCWKCFSDEDLIGLIKGEGQDLGCDFCGSRARSMKFETLAGFIKEKVDENYGRAVDDLPYESAEGGYQGETYDSYDIIREHVDLPRDAKDRLFYELTDYLGEDTYCDYDWTSLGLDVAYRISWERFCHIVKHQRRFFFHDFGADESDRDQISPIGVLHALVTWIGNLNLVRRLRRGTIVWRARSTSPGKPLTSPGELGPPPEEWALQANRMNPAGIPMFYAAVESATAVAETPGAVLSIGKFKLLKDLRIVDLSSLPPIPGFFSAAGRDRRLMTKFLYDFRRAIEQPVARTDGAHIDYLPSQVAAEYIRSNDIDGRQVDGVCYRSIKNGHALDFVFFAEQEHVKGTPQSDESHISPWFELVESRTVRRSRGRKK